MYILFFVHIMYIYIYTYNHIHMINNLWCVEIPDLKKQDVSGERGKEGVGGFDGGPLCL